jgi:hypothetical protein
MSWQRFGDRERTVANVPLMLREPQFAVPDQMDPAVVQK